MFSSVLLFLNIGTPELLLILFVALLLFGGEKLPELARGLGKGIRDFKDASEGVKREIHNQINNFDEKPEETVTTTPPVIEEPKPIVENTRPLLDQVPLVHPVTGTEDASHTVPASQVTPVSHEPAAPVQHTVPVIENHVAPVTVSNPEATDKESK